MKKYGSWELIGYPEFHGHIAEFSRIFFVKPLTMQRWAKKKSLDPSWEGPSTHKDPNKVQVFTVEEEPSLYRFIDVYTLDIWKQMNNKIFSSIALKYYNYLKKTKVFSCTTVFIKKFKRRNVFSIWKAHFKRRPNFLNSEVNKFRYRLNISSEILLFWEISQFKQMEQK